MILAATGHRPDKLGGYGDEVAAKLKDFAVDVFSMAPEPIEEVMSGMALGWDTAIAQAAIELNIPLIAVIPFPEQPSKWPEANATIYQEILSHADQIITISGAYGPGAFQKRNEWMVKNADRIIALWNGSPGGTANCIKYAGKVGKPVSNMWPIWEALNS